MKQHKPLNNNILSVGVWTPANYCQDVHQFFFTTFAKASICFDISFSLPPP